MSREAKREEAVQARLDVFVKLLALFLVVVGLLIFVLTSSAPLPSPLAWTFYLVGALCVGGGLAAFIARFE